MKHAPKIVALAISGSLLVGWSCATAAEVQALRKGPLSAGTDGIANPQNVVTGIERRGRIAREQCEKSVPSDSADRGGRRVPLSSYEDDPFAADSIVECLRTSQLTRLHAQQFLLGNGRVAIEDETVIYRQNANGEFLPFANNPWPQPLSNAEGNFLFPNEPRFPRHEIERDPNGRMILDENGLQIWKPRDIRRGMNTVFDAANAARAAAEHWAGRELRWGEERGDRLPINAHAFVDFNAFFSPTARQLFFGVAPYRLPGETGIETIKMFEMGSSWEVAVHEAGHALHAALKPNRDLANFGYQSWSESLGDQMAMWTALRDPSRIDSLLTETHDLTRSNPLSVIAEAIAAIAGFGTGLRDAVHDRRVSDTPDEVHDRSEVLTGAAYKLFLHVLAGVNEAKGMRAALGRAGDIMGTFLMRAADYMPENTMTLEDVAKGYLKVDKELYRGRYHAFLVDEFTRREIFNVRSVADWHAHEAAVPPLRIRRLATEQEINALLQASLDGLGIGPDFGLKLQSVTRDRGQWQTIVRVQLTLGRGENAELLDNHGILVFRENGALADYHAPLVPFAGEFQSQREVNDQALHVIAKARQAGLDRHGVPLSIVHTRDGGLTAKARVLRGSGINTHAEIFSLEKPYGERRSIITPIAPVKKRIALPEIE
jgi:hypothetical protein